ncbi:hypothetical protein OOT00_07935 [Desulfobotulus sp. H1]|uniref:Uncharacterized protein n=1 Tax=Desulfobotulus pelophilus TaxID=2823377 RepID=A0ABT3N8X5_9BACT|nr:hypothetical protein [Desulfobotulus pelophilus]MCW7753912.1 hypothetical protein [Desulfobotulus pelophilus]
MASLPPFMALHIPQLLNRFLLAYHSEDQCMHYELRRRRNDNPVSKELILSLNAFSHEIHVSKFYPELYREKHSHYLSAACFFLILQHFGHFYDLDESWGVYLDSELSVFMDFYGKLQDFDFHTLQNRRTGTVAVRGHYTPCDLDMEGIIEDRLS